MRLIRPLRTALYLSSLALVAGCSVPNTGTPEKDEPRLQATPSSSATAGSDSQSANARAIKRAGEVKESLKRRADFTLIRSEHRKLKDKYKQDVLKAIGSGEHLLKSVKQLQAVQEKMKASTMAPLKKKYKLSDEELSVLWHLP